MHCAVAQCIFLFCFWGELVEKGEAEDQRTAHDLQGGDGLAEQRDRKQDRNERVDVGKQSRLLTRKAPERGEIQAIGEAGVHQTYDEQEDPTSAIQRREMETARERHVGRQHGNGRHELQKGAGKTAHAADRFIEQHDCGVKQRCAKSAKHAENVNAGLFTYPALMAADILLYQTDLVPVGHDQKQHVELTRDVAQRFNSIHGEVFKIPEPFIPKTGARIMSLHSPDNKMSKSMPEGCVFLMEKPEDIQRKFKRAVTDSDTENCIRYDKDAKPGVANLMSIYSAVTGQTYEQIEAEFAGKGYGAFKPVVGEAVIEHLRPIREETTRLLKDKAYLESVYRAGADRASYEANKTMRKVYKKLGFVAR